MERVKGIEPSSLAWEAKALPLSYTRFVPLFALWARFRQGGFWWVLFGWYNVLSAGFVFGLDPG